MWKRCPRKAKDVRLRGVFAANRANLERRNGKGLGCPVDFPPGIVRAGGPEECPLLKKMPGRKGLRPDSEGSLARARVLRKKEAVRRGPRGRIFLRALLVPIREVVCRNGKKTVVLLNLKREE